ncbi:O-methyltransferase [Flavobacterium gawalongense]|uniref:Class I SAM-dependent methyltransferase n=1 Tax=Flavobacterium gawalongense TaxID=2594432 RepID=A0A553BN75_9FLAO|nr:class I SAM-dependent methyltransferase [Flavobacterium gawalongense]TRX00145.1 class I SAM-dependent methyltransferase [Flavobacterium gawalongense]TRX04893.1 class I SAM-dependent methyltransferase [Flavobacterium gawalongense]TRX09671.1 class I SAM-dependent methyltransferase [Flavobacterium gawalongense]TRX10845.1 class I SAM-dependent methyltransferase [Flavobacterium gawalongense]TRX28076.1 class I SAM-dependent methyltransferase [Flavobacterium gawalongense]
MFFQIKSYLQFLWHSKNEHAVHSPFVFTLLTKCFYDKKSKPEYAVLKNYRKSLLENNNTIEVTDFGAGSKVFKSNTRAISKIAKTAGISPKRAQLLFRITNYLQPESILEIGTSLGLATSALSLGNLTAKIITLEGCPETAKIAQLQLQKFNCNNVESIITAFNSYLENGNSSLNTATEHYKLNTEHFSLIYFDGNHSKKATVDYFELLLPTTINETVWIFDDIHWSPEMEEAWEIIKKHQKVTATIDTFQWGLVFFRREQPKEHFVIRV